MKFAIEIDMEDYDEESIWNQIKSKLADKIIGRIEKKEGQLTKILNDKFKDMIQQEIAIIAEKTINKGLPLYDHCGEQTGCEPWDKVVEKSVESYFKEKVDNSGGKYTGSYSNDRLTRIEHLVLKHGEKAVADAKTMAQNAFKKETEKVIQKVIAQVFRSALP